MLKKKIILFFATFLLVFSFIITAPLALSQNNNSEGEPTVEVETEIDYFPVTLSGEELFFIQVPIGAFDQEERALSITQKIETIAKDSSISVDSITIKEDEETTNIVARNTVILTLTEKDGKEAGISRQTLGIKYLEEIKLAITEYREERSSPHLLKGVIFSLISTVVVIILLNIIKQVFPRIIKFLEVAKKQIIPPLKIQQLELLSSEQIGNLLIKFTQLNKLLIILGIFYVYIPLVCSFFPWTKHITNTILKFLYSSLNIVWEITTDYLPNIIIIIIILIFTYYIIRVLRFFFIQIEQGKIVFPWFYKEWSKPTYKLVTLLIVSLSLVIMFPYLPGFQSPAFQGISLFLGVLLSLGSTAAVSNIVSGVILIYTRAFQEGDRVQIGDSLGNIVEKTLLVTRILTPKNVVITIPNSTVLSSNIINYTANYLEDRPPLILHTTITLGYDVPWRKVYTALTEAALHTDHILKEPSPFIFQTNLNDFYVSYELNVYTTESNLMERIYSQLHENIQDKCNEADIEILSPHYSAIRDGNYTTIPANYLPENYTPPTFRVEGINSQKIQ
jgi:small-conductance mechanosensitive channel